MSPYQFLTEEHLNVIRKYCLSIMEQREVCANDAIDFLIMSFDQWMMTNIRINNIPFVQLFYESPAIVFTVFMGGFLFGRDFFSSEFIAQQAINKAMGK